MAVKIIEELKRREYKVATIKHTHHIMELDKEGSDTYKHTEAGSDITVGVGDKSFFNVKKVLPLDRILFLIKTIEEPDFVVIEGFKDYNYPKISTSKELNDEFTIANVDSFTITDNEVKALVDDVEKFTYDIVDALYTNVCGYNDGVSVGKDIIKGRLNYDPDEFDVSLSIDENVVGLNYFTTHFIKNTLTGMLKTLKTKEFGVKDFDKIELVINNKDNDKD